MKEMASYLRQDWKGPSYLALGRYLSMTPLPYWKVMLTRFLNQCRIQKQYYLWLKETYPCGVGATGNPTKQHRRKKIGF